MAGVYGRLGDLRGALREYRTALEQRRVLGLGMHIDLTGIAWAQLQMCDLVGAREAAEAALAELGALDRPRDRSAASVILGEALAAAGEPREAERTLEEACRIAREAGDSWMRLNASVARLNFLVNDGQIERAEPAAVELVTEAENQGRPLARAHTNLLLARVRAELGRFADADALRRWPCCERRCGTPSISGIPSSNWKLDSSSPLRRWRRVRARSAGSDCAK
jgi:tetratricopeptide (TPR) repeat protein